MTALVTVDEFDVAAKEIENTQRLCHMLMKTKHYAKLGEEGIFAVVQKAKSIGLNPLDALNGAMYYVQGKVELSANTMNYLIRSKGHSITKDAKSDKTICILHGKRADNGDTWTSSFSIDDAKKAGIYRNNWEKYTEDYLFARALTRLARQLFPDVTKGSYIEGEIQATVEQPRNIFKEAEVVKEEPKYLCPEEVLAIVKVFEELPQFKENVMAYLASKGIKEISQITPDYFDLIMQRADKFREKLKIEVAETEELPEVVNG